MTYVIILIKPTALMGSTCCQQPIRVDSELEQATPIEVRALKSEADNYNAKHTESELDSPIQRILFEKKPFESELRDLESTFQFKSYSNGNKYYGQFDQQEKPNGLGKLYKSDGSYIIGYFQDGVLHGKVFYVNRDEVVCQGEVINGKLNCEKATMQTRQFKYSGGFKQNVFDGKGHFVTETSKYQGTYLNGKKNNGQLSWKNGQFIYVYQGEFDQNQKFTGRSKLIEPYGVYEGQFSQGQKHGKGSYLYTSQLRFEGNYHHDKKQGNGKIINKDGSLSYEGSFENGLPHGKGKSYINGLPMYQGNFIEGIYEHSL